jgi:hypothetical protein
VIYPHADKGFNCTLDGEFMDLGKGGGMKVNKIYVQSREIILKITRR